MDQIGVAVVGAGYWGPNLVRNVAANPHTQLRWVCDLAIERAAGLASTYAGAAATSSFDQVLADDKVQAVLIATPASTHAALAIAALRAGKHVLIEKPIAASVAEAERMLAVAAEERRVLMCDHTFCYTSAAQFSSRLVANGELGDIHFVDSVRINLGLVQRDVDVIWDLAPHDLSILDFVLPPDRAVQTVAAHAADPLGVGQSCVAYLTLGLAGGAIGHVHVNWLSPTKVRTIIIGGSRRTLVWDDMNPSQRLCIYDRGVDLDAASDPDLRYRNKVAYRIGDMVAPALRDREALAGVIDELVAGVRGERVPQTDGQAGLAVLRILEAASASLALGGVALPVRPSLAVAR